MAEENETTEDIVGDIRAQNQGLPEDATALSPLVCDLLNLADRLDAARKREMSKNASKNGADFGQLGDVAKLREAISTLRTALKEIRNDVLDMVMNHKSEDPDSYAHGLCLSIGGACDMALNSTKEFDNADK